MNFEKLNNYTTIKEEICRKNDSIAPELYKEHAVNKGLRDMNGNGVVTGLTNISKIISSKMIDGEKVQCDGELWYRGYKVQDLINNLGENEFGFEKIAYLLLLGEMPDKDELKEF